MTKMLFRISRVVALLLGFGMIIYLMEKAYYLRAFIECIMVLTFIGVSFLYERKRKIFSTGYLFLFLVFFITYNLAPCYYIEENILQRKKLEIQVPSDQFFLYVTIYMICMVIIVVELMMKKTVKLPIKREFTYETDIVVLLMGILFCLPLTVYMGISMALLYVPVFCYAFLRIKIRNYRLSLAIFIMLAGSVIAILHFIIYRYIMVEYILPIILAYLFVESYTEKAKPGKIICLLYNQIMNLDSQIDSILSPVANKISGLIFSNNSPNFFFCAVLYRKSKTRKNNLFIIHRCNCNWVIWCGF